MEPPSWVAELPNHDSEWDDLTDSDIERANEEKEAAAKRSQLAERLAKEAAERGGITYKAGTLPAYKRAGAENKGMDTDSDSGDSDESDSDDDKKAGPSTVKSPVTTEAGVRERLNQLLHANDPTVLLDDDLELKTDKDVSEMARQARLAELRKLDRLSLPGLPAELERGVNNPPIKRRKLRKVRLAQRQAKEYLDAARASKEDELNDLAGDGVMLGAQASHAKQLDYAEGMAAMQLPLDLDADHHIQYARRVASQLYGTVVLTAVCCITGIVKDSALVKRTSRGSHRTTNMYDHGACVCTGSSCRGTFCQLLPTTALAAAAAASADRHEHSATHGNLSKGMPTCFCSQLKLLVRPWHSISSL